VHLRSCTRDRLVEHHERDQRKLIAYVPSTTGEGGIHQMKLRWVSFRCFLMGHDDLIRREGDRIYLECRDCGRETRGWTVGRRQQRPLRKASAVKAHASEFAAAA
jgi:hypothetical protein